MVCAGPNSTVDVKLKNNGLIFSHIGFVLAQEDSGIVGELASSDLDDLFGELLFVNDVKGERFTFDDAIPCFDLEGWNFENAGPIAINPVGVRLGASRVDDGGLSAVMFYVEWRSLRDGR